VWRVNNLGQIVGVYGDGITNHGFLLSNGVFTTLDYPGATDTVALGINDKGQIVGTYDGFSYGFLAHPSPEPTSLTLLGIGGAGLMAYRWRRRKVAAIP
jgi:uncharacterized membrane protein